MNVLVYIEKRDFNDFFKWLNQISIGNFLTPIVPFSHEPTEFKEPLKIYLSAREYSAINDVNKDIHEVQKIYGNITTQFVPEFREQHLLIIQDILREADRLCIMPKLVYIALQAMAEIPGLTPEEAMVIAERDFHSYL
jgi:hypothetical protein